MSQGWNTEDVIRESVKTLQKKKVQGRTVKENDVRTVWECLGTYIRSLVVEGKAVALPKFGTFTFLAESPGRKASMQKELMFVLSPEFVKSCNAKQRKGGMPAQITPTRLNNVALSSASKVPKEICKKVVETIVWNITFAINKRVPFVTLSFPCLGVFSCKGQVCTFDVDAQEDGEEKYDSRDDGDDSDEEEWGHTLSENNTKFINRSQPQEQRNSPFQPLKGAPVNRMVIPASVDRLRAKLKEKHGFNGINSLARIIRIMDTNGNGSLDKDELKYGLQNLGIRINNAELDEMFSFFDRDRSGTLNFDELLRGLRGPLSERRVNLINIAFDRLDRTGDGLVTVEDLEMVYDAKHAPEVMSGKMTPAEALRVLLNQFDSTDHDGIVTREEFTEYYKNVSASIDKDDYFELMMRNAWHISGGKGQYENTSNRRVLVTNADGTQRVEEVQDDLWLDRKSEEEIRQRLKRNGVDIGSTKIEHSYTKDSRIKPVKSRRPKPALSSSGTCARPNSTSTIFPENIAGDESMPTSMNMSSPVEDQQVNPIEKLSKLLRDRKLRMDDFLLKIGANRVFGDAVIDVPAFVRGLTRFDSSISESEAKQIARIVDADSNGSINVPELCAQVEGSNVIQRLKDTLIRRGGMNGISTLSRTLRVLDTSKDNALDQREIQEGFQKFGMKLNSADVQKIFAVFDKDHNGKISVDEFLVGIRGDLNERRKSLVSIAFQRLDSSGDGIVTVSDLASMYDPTHHPEFKSGQKTKDEVYREFLSCFDANHDGEVTEEEFVEYYKGISASIDSDDYFELMIRNAWHISGGSGQYENTSNRRVLITDVNGNQTVREIKDDFLVDTNDKSVVSQRLKLSEKDVIDYTYGSDNTSKKTSKAKPMLSSSRRKPKLEGENLKANSLGPQAVKRQAWGSSKPAKQNLFQTDGYGDESIPTPVQDSSTIGLSSLRPKGYSQKGMSGLGAKTNRDHLALTTSQRVEPPVVAKLREKVIQRGGSGGIHTLGRVLRIMDESGDKCLDREELKWGLHDYGVECTDAECSIVFEYLDKDHSGKISFDEFLVGLRGPISKRRVELIKIAFKRLDRTGDGVVTVEDLEATYDTSFHPEVKSGRITRAQALRDFLKQFDTIEEDGIVTEEEFIEYYKNVSASIDSDDYFELMMRNAWHISGGKGQCENTTNRRVLVTNRDGSQSVKEIQDDLWVSKGDEQEMRRRLAKGGIEAIGPLGMNYSNETKSPAKPGRSKPRFSSHTSSISLAWEDEADKHGITIEQLDRKLKIERQRERIIRSGAAERIQSVVRNKGAQRVAQRSAKSTR